MTVVALGQAGLPDEFVIDELGDWPDGWSEHRESALPLQALSTAPPGSSSSVTLGQAVDTTVARPLYRLGSVVSTPPDVPVGQRAFPPRRLAAR